MFPINNVIFKKLPEVRTRRHGSHPVLRLKLVAALRCQDIQNLESVVSNYAAFKLVTLSISMIDYHHVVCILGLQDPLDLLVVGDDCL